MDSIKRCISDFGGLRIRQSGLRLKDRVVIRPFNGQKQEITLNKTRYKFRSGKCFHYNVEAAEIEIPFSSKLFTEYELVLCSQVPNQHVNEDGRYLLRAKGVNPFRINGSYGFETFLEYGDVVDLEFTRLEVLKPLAEDGEEALPFCKNLIESEMNLLIEGETGTGKSTLAKRIHESSFRRGPFVQVNIASYSSTLIESELFGHVKGAFTGANNSKRGAFSEANNGTLFIDEIDSLPKEIQTKLLLFLDSKKIRPVGGDRDVQLNVRLIFSSGQPLKSLVESQIMRKDFYFRISTGGRVRLKSLRENRNQITRILNNFEKEKGVFIVPELRKYYRSCEWPGNIRQLKGHLEQKLILSGGNKISFGEIDEDFLSPFPVDGMISSETGIEPLIDVKKRYINIAYQKLDNNVKKTARVLGVSPNTIRTVVREFSLQ